MPGEPTSDGPLRARFEDAARGTPALAEIDGYTGRLPRDAGLVLDATCGSVRLLLPLLARGIAIHGADDSAEALALAQARLDAASLKMRPFVEITGTFCARRAERAHLEVIAALLTAFAV